MKIQVRKYKEINKPCPKCGAIMDYDIIKDVYHMKGTYCIAYECPNGCELKFKESYEDIKTDEPMIWYEEEEIDV